MLDVYDAGFIDMKKHILTVGVNGIPQMQQSSLVIQC